MKKIKLKRQKKEKVQINRMEALTNCVYFHGHFYGYIAIVMILIGFITLNIFPFLAAFIMIYPEYIYLIDIFIGKAIPVKGNIVSEKPSILYSIFKINGDDNYCNKTILEDDNGNKTKVLCYESTVETTYNNKVKVKQHKSGFDCTVYYLPLSKLVIDIDYKYKYNKTKKK